MAPALQTRERMEEPTQKEEKGVGVSGLAWHFKAGHQRVSAVSLW